MRSKFVDTLLRENEEPDFEGMFKAASLDMEWTPVVARDTKFKSYSVKFGVFNNNRTKREIKLEAFQLVNGQLGIISSHFSKRDSVSDCVSTVLEWSLFQDGSLILPLETLKEVTENWIHTVWYPICKTGIENERCTFRSFRKALREAADSKGAPAS